MKNLLHCDLKFITLLKILLLVAGLSSAAFGATFTVTNTNDSGLGSLRQAILDATVNGADDIIEFDTAVFSAPQIIILTSGELNIEPDVVEGVAKSLTINGTGANLLTISGNNQSRVISSASDSRVTISKVKITGGNGIGRNGSVFNGLGGGVLAIGNFTIRDSLVSENRTLNSSHYGGGLAFFGTGNFIVNTTVFNNTSLSGGGGVSISSSGELRIINSTVSSNTTGALGGGIHNAGTLYMVNCTVAFNRATNTDAQGASAGGGIYVQPTSQYMPYIDLYARNTIFAKNTTGSNYGNDVSGFLKSSGSNIISSGYGAIVTGNAGNDQIDVDPLLDPHLSINGGVLLTHGLSAASPAIDRGDNCVLSVTSEGGCLDPNITTDQRGVARPQDGDGNGTALVDIGAFEATRAEVEIAPFVPDLQPVSDSGTSNTDNITSTNSNLPFNSTGVAVGALVELLRDGVVVSEVNATATAIVLSDASAIPDGTYLYAVRQTIGDTTSLQSTPLAVKIDTTPTMVTINQSSGQAEPTKTQPINFTVNFDEDIVGFTASDVSLADSTAGVSSAIVHVTGSGRTYNVSISNITSDGTIRATILPNAVQDLAGNSSAASISTDNSVTFDTTPPTVTINQAANQTDPTRNSQVNFTVVFSETVNTFSSVGVSLAGSTANVSSASIVITGSGTTYNVAINNVNSNGGFVRASIYPSAAIDLVALPNNASTSTDNEVTVDNVSPTVTINQAVGQSDPAGSLPVNYTVIFSEPVTGFDAADVSLTGSTISTSGANIVVTGSGTTYNVAVSNINIRNGILRASVRSSAATDSVGNSSFGSTSNDNSVALRVTRLFDYDGDGKAEVSVFRPSNGTWYLQQSSNGFSGIQFGALTDKVVPADYDGDGKTDVAVYRNGTWYLQRSSAGFTGIAFGANEDIPVPADFSGDGKSELAVFRPTNGTWYIYNLATNQVSSVQFGINGDKPVAADYDGDGRTDVAVFRPSNGTWYLQRSTAGFIGISFGEITDKPVVGDYDGDNRADIAVFRPSNGTWYLLRSTSGFIGTQFGLETDSPVPADYDGDGKTDVAVFRDGNWYLNRSSAGFTGVSFGAATDKPVPNAFVP